MIRDRNVALSFRLLFDFASEEFVQLCGRYFRELCRHPDEVVAGPFCLKTGLTQGADKARRFLEALFLWGIGLPIGFKGFRV